jgi:NAD(P)-dependent dehydrogenase (short-subunit alcohol dehydrogenase family)
LVTGAGRGLGRAIARGFARQGARVAANDITPVNLDPSVEDVRAEGGEAEPFVADVANRLAVEAMVDEVRQRFGRIDMLVNHAGVEPRAPLLDLDEYDWDRTLAVNLKGSFLLIQIVGRLMAAQGGGAIVNIVGAPTEAASRSAYFAAQSGLIGLTQAAARELAAYNIRVNAVCPGGIEIGKLPTRRQDSALRSSSLNDIPIGRLGSTEEVVPLVLFLCSPQAANITGQAIQADGGRTAS